MKAIKRPNIFVKRKYDKDTAVSVPVPVQLSPTTSSIPTAPTAVSSADECQVRDLGDGAIVRYYPNFLTFEEQKELYEHLLSDMSVQWTQGKYKGYPLPRMLWSMRSPDLKLADTNEKVDEKTSADTKVKIENEGRSTKLESAVSTAMSSPITPVVKLTFDTSYQKYTGTGSSVWTLLMAKLKTRIERQFNIIINYCQLNYYRDGQDSISWHADHELLPMDCIYSVSLYLKPEMKREFLLWAKSAGFPKHKSKADAAAADAKKSKSKTGGNSGNARKVVLNERGKVVLASTALEEFMAQVVSYWLTPGSLLVMNYAAANSKYWHTAPKDDEVKDGRINITFRRN